MPSSLRWVIFAVIVGLVILRAVQRHSEEQAVAEYQARPLITEIVADDPAAREVVTKAIKTPSQAASCRINEEITNVAHGYSSTKITAELVKPDKVHVREEGDGALKSESFTDGQKLLVRKGAGGQFIEEREDVAGKIKRLAPSIGDPYPEDKMQQAGHEVINGVPATIYKWESTRMYVSKRKLWVADADGRLLKFESQSKGTVPLNKAPIHIDTTSTTTYEYDVPLNISLPAQ